MKCYRIRKKKELLTQYEQEWMQRRDEPDYFMSDWFSTLRGAKSAINNRNGYLNRHGNDIEIVEYDIKEVGVVQ